MSEPTTAIEHITTVEDGPGTVNERLSTGGPGPEGQLDTVVEKLSGQPALEAVKADGDDERPEEPVTEKPAAKKALAKKTSAKKS